MACLWFFLYSTPHFRCFDGAYVWVESARSGSLNRCCEPVAYLHDSRLRCHSLALSSATEASHERAYRGASLTANNAQSPPKGELTAESPGNPSTHTKPA